MRMTEGDSDTKQQSPFGGGTNVISGDGIMANLVRTKDWSKTVLGPIESWPQSLVTTLNLILASRFPMIMFWGPSHKVIFYNDAYIPISGLRHPSMFGRMAVDVLGEKHLVIPMLRQVFATGNSTWCEDLPLMVTRNNYDEEGYFIFSYSVVRNERGEIAGVITPITETTNRVLSDRRMKLLRELSNKTTIVNNCYETCQESTKTIADHPDLPFTLVYLASSSESNSWNLVSYSGLNSQQAISFPSIVQRPTDSDNSESNQLLYKVFSEASSTNTVVAIREPSNYFGELPGRREYKTTLAYAVPIPSDHSAIAGVLFVGINPCRAFDDDYKGFLELLAGQLGRSISSARAYEAERKRAEALAEIDRAKTQFFSNVSHELRTPLTLIKGPLEDLLSDDIQEDRSIQKDKLHLIHRNALRLEKLVNSLLDFTRIEAGRATGTFSRVDLSSCTADIASMFRSAFQQANLDFVVDCSHLSKDAFIDINMWEKIVLNLLSNAFKYTLTGSVALRLDQDADHAVLRVTDTGIGISAANLDRVFERFHRIERSRGRSHEGTGIGLALLQELVKLHGGTVRVDSELGVGSTFEVRIPLGSDHLPPDQISKEASNATLLAGSQTGAAYISEVMRWLPSSQRSITMETTQQANETTTTTKARILLADDNSDVREYISSLLKKEGWEVEAVSNGREAFQAAKARKPDLILSDVMMPVVDGFQLIQLLKEEASLSFIPIVLLSARAGDEAKVEGLRAGADDYLVKPFSTKELIARINTHLEIGKMRDELEFKVRERTEELQKINADLQSEIQQRREIEKALAESEEHYRTLMSISPVGIFHTNLDGVLTYANRYWTNLTGLTVSQLQTKQWFEQIIHPRDRDAVAALFEKVQRDNIQFSYEFRLLLAGNKKVWVLGQLISERSKTGEVVGYVGTITDVTERKKLEKERLKTTKELAQQKTRIREAQYYQQQQDQFIDMICHEIRNPLTGVDGNADLMKDTLHTINNWIKDNQLMEPMDLPTMLRALQKEVSKLIESVDSISECVEHQKLIVNDVLDLSKLEANKIELNIRPFSAISTVTSVKKMFETQALKKHLSLNVIIPPEDIVVKGDYARVAQILINFVSNAIKFTHSGEVTLELIIEDRTKTSTTLRFNVSDTGVGLSTEEKEKIFQRFAQASRYTSVEYGGSGLGLFISKNLARLMGGDIWVESEKWKGSKFVAVVKCENTTEVIPSPSHIPKIQPIPAEVDKQESLYRILVVEDNRINQQLLSKYFQQSHFSYLIANNGQEAVNIVERSLKEPVERIDLILMDIEMPVMNGYEATMAIRKLEASSNHHIPIIGLSGNARCSQIQQALTAGMDDYITKPFKRAEVFGKIREHLEAEVFYTPSVPAPVAVNHSNNNSNNDTSSSPSSSSSISPSKRSEVSRSQTGDREGEDNDGEDGVEPNAKRTKII